MASSQPLSSLSCNLDDPSENKYEVIYSKGKALASSGRLEESLQLLQKAYAIQPSVKLKRHIEKIETLLKDYGHSSIEMVDIAEGFQMSSSMYNNLYPYQQEAVIWMWGLFKKKKGGVLGDDMGLGKTIQIIAFLSAMLEEGHIKTVLLVMPVSLIQNWKKEFVKWAPEIIVNEYHTNSKKDRERSLSRIQHSGGVLLTTYGIVTKNFDTLRTYNDRDFTWDYVVLDEGHKIRNPTKTTKALHDIYAKHRLVLTGTPIQNNLKELWSLYNFVHQGSLLGSLKTFKIHYETPIVRSREKDATQGEKLLGSRIAESLRKIIAPFFLRRTKREVLHSKDDEKENKSTAFSKLKRDMMIRKNEFVVWVYLSPPQIKIYEEFLQTDRVKSILTSAEKRSPLVELTVLKKICDHPRLLSHRSCLQLGLEENMTEKEVEEALEKEEALYFDISNTTDESLIGESGKMGVVFDLLENLRSEGHRTLLFSLSCRILDIVQKVLGNRGWKLLRLDGKIKKTIDREKIVTAFQTDSSYPLLLLTTQVGGVGLNLTAADRVIIYDPSWNPATDAQAVDRAYRIGQTRSVVVYRLVTCGSIEEKIYRRQIFKDSIMQQTTGVSRDPHRYFTKGELWDLFNLDNPRVSTTQQQLEGLHGGQRKSDTALDSHIAYLYSLQLYGISDHDLMFQGIEEEELDEEGNKSFVRERVEKAQLLLTLESNLPKEVVPNDNTNKTSVNPVLDRYPPTYEIPVVVLDTSVKDIENKFDKLDMDDVSRTPSPIDGDNSPIENRDASQNESSADNKKSKEIVPDYLDSKFGILKRDNSSAKKEDFVIVSDDEDLYDVNEDRRSDAYNLGAIEVSDSDEDFHKSPFLAAQERLNKAYKERYRGEPDDGSSTEPCESDDEMEFESSAQKMPISLNQKEKPSLSDAHEIGASEFKVVEHPSPQKKSFHDGNESDRFTDQCEGEQKCKILDQNTLPSTSAFDANRVLSSDRDDLNSNSHNAYDSDCSTEPCVDTEDDDDASDDRFRVNSTNSASDSDMETEQSLGQHSQEDSSRVNVANPFQKSLTTEKEINWTSGERVKRSSPCDSEDEGQNVDPKKRFLNSPAKNSSIQQDQASGNNSVCAEPLESTRRKSIRRSHVFCIASSDESENSDGFYSALPEDVSDTSCKSAEEEQHETSTDYSTNGGNKTVDFSFHPQPSQSSSPMPKIPTHDSNSETEKSDILASVVEDSIHQELSLPESSLDTSDVHVPRFYQQRKKVQILRSDSDTD